jgi:hypothetical protein
MFVLSHSVLKSVVLATGHGDPKSGGAAWLLGSGVGYGVDVYLSLGASRIHVA